MNYLNLENISRSIGEIHLFKNLNLSIDKGDRVALVANNGAGKTTLLKIIFGLESPDQGSVYVDPNIRFDYLQQDPKFHAEETVYETLFRGDNPLMNTVAMYEKALSLHSAEPENTHYQQQYLEAIHLMDVHHAWTYENKIKTILTKLKLYPYLNKQANTISGGQQRRLAIAGILIHEPDFLILDEPTNHLDIEMIEWLEKYLIEEQITLLMVSHDRYFIDTICNKIIELDQNQLFSYKCKYTQFLEQKASRETNNEKEFEGKKKRLVKELEWLRRQPKARTTKSKSRVDAAEKLIDETQFKKRKNEIEFIVDTKRIGTKILELQQVSKSFENKQLIRPFTYIFNPGEKIGIIGNNGTGKTTFLEMILGNLNPDEGKIERGDTVQFGYFSQKGMNIDSSKKVIDIITDKAEYIELGKGVKLSATALLKRFLFDYKKQQSPVSVLSGGEKRRLFLLTVLMDKPNFLILDEPTNDMDIETLNVLEEFLEQYAGNLLLVTHDRYFMDHLVDSLLIFEGNGTLRHSNGNYQDYLNEKEESKIKQKQIESSKTEKTINQTISSPTKQKLSFKENRELEQLTLEIPQIEERKNEYILKLNAGEGSYEEMQQWSKDIIEFQKKLDEMEYRWLELNDRLS